MKNYLLIFTALLLFSNVGVSQNIEIHNTRSFDLTNGQLTVVGSPDEFEIEADLVILNTSDSEMSIKVRRTIISVEDGTSNAFCWTGCYFPSINESPSPVTLSAGDSTLNFSGHFKPLGIVGTNVIAYTFFDENNISDSSRIEIVYDIKTSSINEQNILHTSMSIYPNPVSSYAVVNYSLKHNSNANLTVYNMLGKQEMNYKLNSNTEKINIDLSTLTNGTYFYSIIVEGKIEGTKRFVVNH